MCLWNIEDGRCLEHTKTQSTHTVMQVFVYTSLADIRLGVLYITFGIPNNGIACQEIMIRSTLGFRILWWNRLEHLWYINIAPQHQTKRHTFQAYQVLKQRDVWLVCTGYYPDIQVFNPATLECMFSLSSRLNPDWISAFCVIRPVGKEGKICLSLSLNQTRFEWFTYYAHDVKQTHEQYTCKKAFWYTPCCTRA